MDEVYITGFLAGSPWCGALVGAGFFLWGVVVLRRPGKFLLSKGAGDRDDSRLWRIRLVSVVLMAVGVLALAFSLDVLWRLG